MNIVEYLDTSFVMGAKHGREEGSFISTEEREFSLRQSKSAFVYGTAAFISHRGASIEKANFFSNGSGITARRKISYDTTGHKYSPDTI